jgi:hypothetical protein
LRPNQEKTSPPVLRSKQEKPSPPVLRSNREKPSQWFGVQSIAKRETLVLRLNQETHAPHLLMHGVDHTQRHPTSQSSGHRVSNLCDYPRSSAPGLLHLSRYSSLPTMPHLPPAHHEASKRNSPHEPKYKSKTTKIF